MIGLSIDFNSRFFTIETNNPLFKNKIKKVPTKRNIESMQVSSSQSVILQNLKFYPQFSVNIKGKAYRLDFAFLLNEGNNEGVETRKKVAIECDGYDFHYTPQQFNKDRERQRLLSSNDWIVLNYSGSQINGGKIDFREEFNRIFSILGFSGHGVFPHL